MKILSVASLFIIISISTSSSLGQSKSIASPSNLNAKPDEFVSPFRYVIVAGVTGLEKYVNEDRDYLVLEVLMDDKSFNEKNLRVLFGLLSNRFVKTPSMMVDVYTSLDAIKTPEENDASNLKDPRRDYLKYKHANYVKRAACDEEFEYSIPGKIKNRRILLSICNYD